jgi:hypothetical protein
MCIYRKLYPGTGPGLTKMDSASEHILILGGKRSPKQERFGTPNFFLVPDRFRIKGGMAHGPPS